jgi:DNA polymerase-3 subunit gamma/tau
VAEPVAGPAAEPTVEPTVEPTAPASASAPPEPPAAPQPRGGGGLSLSDVRQLWPDVVESTKTRRRMAWIHLTQNCQVVGLDGNVLTLGFANPGARDSFVSSGCTEVVHQAAIDVVGADWKIETIVDPGAQPEGTPTVTKAATDPTPPAAAPAAPASSAPAAAAAPAPAAPAEPAAPPAWAADEPDSGSGRAAAREAIQQTRAKGAEAPRSDDLALADAEASRDDLDADPEGLGGEDLLARELGASMIEEIKNS